MSMNNLIEFRTTYLRAIAEAWASDTFRQDLITNAQGTLRTQFNYTWPWDVCTLKIVASNASQAAPYGQGNFKWVDDQDGWVYSPDLTDALTLYVPLAPRSAGDASTTMPLLPSDQWAKALGDYYRQYASLFSDSWGQPPSPWTTGGSTSATRGGMAPVIGPDSDSPFGGFIPSDEEFAAFKVALLGAMAKAWQEAGAKATAQAAGQARATPFTSMLTIDGAAALNTIRGYKLPWNMRIRLADNTDTYWTPTTTKDNGDGTVTTTPSQWSRGTPSVLQLYLPDTPNDVNVTSWPLALATYNATGAEFPFTCTC